MDIYYKIKEHVNCAKQYSSIVGKLLYKKEVCNLRKNNIQILLERYYTIKKNVNCANLYSNIVGELLYNKEACKLRKTIFKYCWRVTIQYKCQQIAQNHTKYSWGVTIQYRSIQIAQTRIQILFDGYCTINILAKCRKSYSNILG